MLDFFPIHKNPTLLGSYYKNYTLTIFLSDQ